jgi:hypothetical protein
VRDFYRCRFAHFRCQTLLIFYDPVAERAFGIRPQGESAREARRANEVRRQTRGT